MWNTSNRELCARFGPGKAMPSETDYGTYVARELMALGYAPRQIYVTGQPVFVMSVPVMNGQMEAVLICRVLQGDVDIGTTRSLVSLRAIRKAVRHVIVTTGKFDDQSRQYLAANKVPGVGQFMMGGDISRVMDAVGLVPGALLKLLGSASAKVAELEKKLYEAKEALAYQEEQAETASRGAPAPEKKPPERMTGAEKFRAGLMDPLVPKAMQAIAGTNATSAGALVKRMGCTPEKAEALLGQLEEMGVVTPAAPGAPRFVKMTKGMMENAFGLSGTGQDGFLA